MNRSAIELAEIEIVDLRYSIALGTAINAIERRRKLSNCTAI